MTRWYGKLFGLIAGWLLLRHPGGAVVGVLVGHAFDSDWLSARRDRSHAVLGLDAQATEAEVDLAYRRLIAQYHPDRVAGAASELREQAERRSRELNAAYDRIKSRRKRR